MVGDGSGRTVVVVGRRNDCSAVADDTPNADEAHCRDRGDLDRGSAVARPIRDQYRTPIYAEAAGGLAFDVHTLSRAPAGGWPLWHRLDGMTGTRLAVSGGFVADTGTADAFIVEGDPPFVDVRPTLDGRKPD